MWKVCSWAVPVPCTSGSCWEVASSQWYLKKFTIQSSMSTHMNFYWSVLMNFASVWKNIGPTRLRTLEKQKIRMIELHLEKLINICLAVLKKITFSTVFKWRETMRLCFINCLLSLNDILVLISGTYFLGNCRDFQVHEWNNVSESVS